ncbi:MAG: hypothetical protein ABH816_00890 [Candidatus Levyibacteriota bacterium]
MGKESGKEKPISQSELFYGQVVAKAKGIFDQHFPEEEDIRRALEKKRVANYQKMWSVIYLKLIDLKFTKEWRKILRDAGFKNSTRNYVLGLKKLTTFISSKKGLETSYALGIFIPTLEQKKQQDDTIFKQARIKLDSESCDIELNELAGQRLYRLQDFARNPFEERLKLTDQLLDTVNNALVSGVPSIKCQSIGFDYSQGPDFTV